MALCCTCVQELLGQRELIEIKSQHTLLRIKNEVTWEYPHPHPEYLVRGVSLFPVLLAQRCWTVHVGCVLPGTWSARGELRTVVYWQGYLSFSELFILVPKGVTLLFCC